MTSALSAQSGVAPSGEAPSSKAPRGRRLREAALRLRRPDAVTLAVLGVTALALVLRLYDLGGRAMHHDESLHATFAFYLAEGRGYVHDPLMHGPLQFHVIAALFRLFGDGEAMARLLAALAGTALVAAPLLLRRSLGGVGTVVAALLLALSPSLLYFSRFARNDVVIALWTLLIVAAVWRYREEGGQRWLVLLAATLALAFATKETVYLTVAVLLIYLDVALARTLLARRPSRGRRRMFEAAALLPTAWLIAVLWRPLGRRLAPGPRPRDADLLVVLGTLSAPFLAAGVAPPLGWLGLDLSGDGERAVGAATVLLLMGGSAAAGLHWDWRRWALLAAIFYAITLPLYSTGFTNLDGLGSGLWGSLDYWLDQQDVRRGSQPGFYYLMMLPLYEMLSLVPALVGGAWLVWRGDRLARMLAWWFLGTLVALSLAGEKMPWLTVHLALPLAMLAARVAGEALPAAGRALRGRGATVAARAGGGVAAVAVMGMMALLLALSLRTAGGVVYGHPDTPIEPLIYTQTSPDVPALAREIESFAAAGPGSARPPVYVDTTASFSWPWVWYLRDYSGVRYVSAETIADGVPEGSILIATDSTLAANPGLRDGFAEARPYRHRLWFPEQRYRETTPTTLIEGIGDGSLLTDWIDFFADRIEEDAIGSIDGEVLFPPRPAAAGG